MMMVVMMMSMMMMMMMIIIRTMTPTPMMQAGRHVLRVSVRGCVHPTPNIVRGFVY